MKRTGLICNRWEMEFEDYLHNAEDFGHVANIPYNHYLFGKKLELVSASTFSAYELLKGLPKKKRVVEFFGGVGLQSTIIQELLQPIDHTIIENDGNCIRHLNDNFRGRATILQANAFDYIGALPGDIFSLDWNSWTVLHQDKLKSVFELLLKYDPLAIIWFDTAKSYFHLNRSKYSKLLGMELSTIRDYSEALFSFFERKYNYGFSKVAYFSKGTHFLLVPNPSKLEHIEIPRSSGGFRWL